MINVEIVPMAYRWNHWSLGRMPPIGWTKVWGNQTNGPALSMRSVAATTKLPDIVHMKDDSRADG